VVSGNVLGPTGAAVPVAVVTAVNLDTGVKRAVISNASGDYRFTALPPGHYRFRAEKPGFKRLELSGTTLLPGDRLRQNLTLQMAGKPETVETAVAAP
jgi:hypothetical protein